MILGPIGLIVPNHADKMDIKVEAEIVLQKGLVMEIMSKVCLAIDISVQVIIILMYFLMSDHNAMKSSWIMGRMDGME